MSDEERFGDYLRSLRRCAGMSQEDLADISGSSVRTIRELERGRVRNPHRRTVHLIADALRLSDVVRNRFVALGEMNRFSGGHSETAIRDVALDDPAAVPVPRQLPAAPTDLVGREPELSMIARRTGGAAVAGPHRGPVLLVHGAPGIGKTSVAVAAAHRIAGWFPDGQLFAHLGGAAPGGPVPAADVLAHLLRSLAVPESAIPAPGAAREGLFRTLLHDRRILLVLDDAYDEAQVRPLLPAGTCAAVLVTARRPLSGLDVAERIRLDVLGHDQAWEMLATSAGHRRVAADPSAMDELVRVCGRWPLALRVAGNRLASRPAWGVRHLLDRLRDQRRRLGLLNAGDLDLRAAFTESYRQLDPVAAAVFRSAAVIPGADFHAALAAAVSGIDEETAASACEDLLDAGLLQGTADRYSFHELVRSFAAECLDDDGPGRAVARDRAARWQLGRVRRAVRGSAPHSIAVRSRAGGLGGTAMRGAVAIGPP
ncbi:NB-ARC domain-containing protein [Actinoplanes teichomyceticus]|uniref:NB-ARC domain-containing protein n=1 Tax=Actinoplanes teichomyceticus TaxID=1867 RepID=A0A561VGS7_ACTTI|nr:NB-ARC domain-containing protein [Actinoplanes teichomyceticus]